MEYLDEFDLRTLLKMCAIGAYIIIPKAPCLYTVIQVASGLDKAHNLGDPRRGIHGILHSDTPRANIFISYSREVKFGDFGIATIKGPTRSCLSSMVKSSFLASERIRGGIVAFLGVVLYEILSEKRSLFLSATQERTMNRILKEEPPPIRDLNPDISDDLQEIVMNAIRNNRIKNFRVLWSS